MAADRQSGAEQMTVWLRPMLPISLSDLSRGGHMDLQESSALVSDLLTPAELAERWVCTVGHLANMRSAGAGPTYLKLGASVRYRITDLLAYEESHAVSSA